MVPATATNFLVYSALMVPFNDDDSVVIVKTVGTGGGAGSGVDTLLLSLQALRPKVAQIHRQTHTMFLVIVRPFTSAVPLFWR